jgi:ABC-2 type transport system permease protein
LSVAATRDVLRNRVGLFFTFIFPLIFLGIFGLVFGRQAAGDFRVIDYLAPGVMCWGIGNGALFGVAYTLVNWRQSDVLRLVRMTPTRVPEILGSRYLVALGVGVAQAVFFVIIAVLPGFGMHVSPSSFSALPVLVVSITAFFAMGLLVGSYATSPDTVAAIANVIMIPMAFLSGTFFPIESMPGWIQGFSYVLPLRYMTDGMGVLSGTKGVSAIVVPCLVLIGFTVLFGLFATKFFRWQQEVSE